MENYNWKLLCNEISFKKENFTLYFYIVLCRQEAVCSGPWVCLSLQVLSCVKIISKDVAYSTMVQASATSRVRLWTSKFF